MEILFKLFQDGQLPQLEQWLLLVNILDVVTGLIKAIDTKNVSSKVMKHGALSKIIIWVIVFVSAIVSSYFKTDLTSYVIGYYLIMEIVSIFENASQFVAVPDKLKDILNVNNIETSTTETQVTETAKDNEAQIDQRIFDEINKGDN